MSSSAAAAGGAPFGTADDRVYRAVAAGASVDEVRRAIERSRSLTAVNRAGANGETPLQAAHRLYRSDLLCLFLENGAEAGDGDEFEAVSWCVKDNDLAGLRRLISVNTTNHSGTTPLMEACFLTYQTADRRDLTLEILRRSSARMRRAVTLGGWSAVDWMLEGRPRLQPWQAVLAGELLAAGCSVKPFRAPRAVPLAAAHAARREAELVACRSMAHDWRAQENFVRLSLDVGELRCAERAVAARRARLEAFERELGGETDSGSSSGSEIEEDEASGSGGGGE